MKSDCANRGMSSSVLKLCFLFVLCVLLTIPCISGQDIHDVRQYFTSIQERRSDVFCGAVGAWNWWWGVAPFVSGGVGTTDAIGSAYPMSLSKSFRTNTLSEMFLDMAVVYLENTSRLPFGRTQTIPSAYLPPPFNDGTQLFQNALFPTSIVSLETLLYHTSSLTEAGFDTGAAQTPGPAMRLEGFVEVVFATQGAAVWGNTRPGLPASYAPSRLNPAVVTYILNKVLAAESNPTTVAALIQNVFIAPLGLTGTFLADLTGAPPVPSYPSGSTAAMTGVAVQDVDSTGNSIAASVTIHAAYTSDYMYYTNGADLLKLVSEVFLDGNLSGIGEALKSNPVFIQDPRLPPVSGRTLGSFLFDATQLCQIAAKAEVYCNFPSDTVLHGWVAGGAFNALAFLCSDNGCAMAEMSHYQNENNSVDNASLLDTLIFATLPLQHVIGLPRTRELEGGPLYGLYVFLGVLGTIVVTLCGSFMADYVIQPPRATKAIPMPRPGLPMHSESQDAEEENGASSDANKFNNSQGVAPTVRRLDVYE